MRQGDAPIATKAAAPNSAVTAGSGCFRERLRPNLCTNSDGIALHHHRERNRFPGMRLVVKVISGVIADIKIVRIEPRWRPVSRPRIHHHERVPSVPKLRITTHDERLAADPKAMTIAEVKPKTGLRNIVTAIPSALTPAAMLTPPIGSAICLEARPSLPAARLLPPALLLPCLRLLCRTLRRSITSSCLSAGLSLLRGLRALSACLRRSLLLRLLRPLLLLLRLRFLFGLLSRLLLFRLRHRLRLLRALRLCLRLRLLRALLLLRLRLCLRLLRVLLLSLRLWLGRLRALLRSRCGLLLLRRFSLLFFLLRLREPGDDGSEAKAHHGEFQDGTLLSPFNGARRHPSVISLQIAHPSLRQI